jgi:tetratricopeptide (TPR) repeat protein
MTPERNIREAVPPEVTAALKAGIAAAERKEYESALRIFSAVYASSPNVGGAEALSYYGLCLAKVEKKFNPAIKLCQRAIELQFYESEHYVNLIDVYLLAGSRKRAVETLERGLAKIPRDPRLVAKRASMGFRSDPVLRFLHRDNRLNIALGRMRHRRRMRVAEGEKFSKRHLLWLIPLLLLGISGAFWLLVHFS